MNKKIDSCKSKIFLQEDVEQIIDSIFDRNYNEPTESSKEKTIGFRCSTAIFLHKMESYAAYFCLVTPEDIKKLVIAETEKNFSQHGFNNMNETNPCNSDTNALVAQAISMYHEKLNHFQNFIIMRYFLFAEDYPNCKDHLNITFFKDYYFPSLVSDKFIRKQLTELVIIAFEHTAFSSEFFINYDCFLLYFFRDLLEFIKKRLGYIGSFFLDHTIHLKETNKYETAKLNIASYNTFATLEAKNIALLENLDKIRDKIADCYMLLDSKLECDIINPIKIEILLLIKELKSDKHANGYKIKSVTYDKIQTFMMMHFSNIKNEIVELDKQKAVLDIFVLKIGHFELMEFKRALNHTNEIYQTATHDFYSLCNDILYKMRLDITDSKLDVTNDIDKYLLKIKKKFARNIELIKWSLQCAEEKYNIARDAILNNSFKDNICLDVLHVECIDIIYKLNGVFDYIDNKWIQKISYFEVLTESFLYLDDVRNNCALFGLDLVFISNDDIYKTYKLEKRIIYNFQMLIKAYRDTKKIFLDVFETNYLNEIPMLKKLLNEKLLCCMSYYKKCIIKFTKKLSLRSHILNLDVELFDKPFLPYNGVYDRRLIFTPHKSVLNVYSTLDATTDMDQDKDSNYKLIMHLKDLINKK
ncbi:hypothetical protein COBT_000763 [Conglomerata obtusa]